MDRDEMKALVWEVLEELLTEREETGKARYSEKEARLLRLLQDGGRSRSELQRYNNFSSAELTELVGKLGLEEYRDNCRIDGAWRWHIKRGE